jgi:hypothetical protein
MTKEEITLGQRVAIIGDHPWAGKFGTVIGFEYFAFTYQTAAVVSVEGGGSCYVFHPENLSQAPDSRE